MAYETPGVWNNWSQYAPNLADLGRLQDEAVARAQQKYPQWANNEDFIRTVREAYVPRGASYDEHQQTSPGMSAIDAAAAQGWTDYTPEDNIAALYAKTVGNPNFKADKDQHTITDAEFWDNLSAGSGTNADPTGIHLQKLDNHNYFLDPSNPNGVTKTQAESPGPWVGWGRQSAITGASMAATVIGLGYLSAAGAAAGAATTGAGAGATAAEMGATYGTTAGTAGASGASAGTLAGLTGASGSATPGYFAGDTLGAAGNYGSLGGAGAGAGGLGQYATLENAGKAGTAATAGQQGLDQLGGSGGGGSEVVPPTTTGTGNTIPQGWTGEPGTTGMTPQQEQSWMDAVKGGASSVTQWIQDNPMLASQLAQAGINAYTGYKAQQAMQNLPNWEEAKLPAGYYEDPFVQQNLGQINRQVSSAAAARGMNMSGRTLQEIADNSYSKAILPFMQMQYGQNATKNQFNYNKGLAEQGATAGYWSGIGQNASDVAGSWSLQNMMNQQNAQNQQYNQKLDAILGKL